MLELTMILEVTNNNSNRWIVEMKIVINGG